MTAPRGGVHDEEVVFVFKAINELGEGGAFEELGGNLGATAGAQEGEVFADVEDAEVGVGGEVGAIEARAAFEPDKEAVVVGLLVVAVEHGATEVAIDEEGAFAVAGEGAGEVGGDEGLAFAGDGGGDEDGLGEIQL